MALFSAFGPCAKFLAPAKTASGHWGNCRLAFLTLSSSHSDPQQSLAYLVGWRHFSHRVTSYSRDIAFAGRLEAGPKDHGFTPLVDRANAFEANPRQRGRACLERHRQSRWQPWLSGSKI